MNFYNEFRIFRKLHFSITWILVGFVNILLQQLVFNSLGVVLFPYTRAVLTLVVVSGIPIAIAYFHSYFPSYCAGLEKVINRDGEVFDEWVEGKGIKIFSLRNREILVGYLLINTVLIPTTILIGLPYDNTVIIWVVVFLQPLSLLAGHAVFFVFQVLKFFKEVSESNLNNNFGRPPDMSLHGILQFSSRLSIIAFFLYLTHFISFFFSDFWNTVPIFIWMAFTAIFPLILFGYSMSLIHVLMRRMKFQSIENINQEIQKVFREIQQEATKQDAETLELLLSVQNSLERSKTWPISLEGLFTLFLTIIPVGAQVAITLIEASTH